MIRKFGGAAGVDTQPVGLLLGQGTGGTAAVVDVLTGKTFTNDTGQKNGTMTNNGAVTITPSGSDQAISAGYHNGAGKVKAVPVAAGSNILVAAYTDGSYKSCYNTSWEKVMEATIMDGSGTVRVSYDVNPNYTTANSMVEKNGVWDSNTVKSVTGSSWVTYTLDIPFVSGDKIAVYGYTGTGGQPLYFRNFKLSTSILFVKASITV